MGEHVMATLHAHGSTYGVAPLSLPSSACRGPVRVAGAPAHDRSVDQQSGGPDGGHRLTPRTKHSTRPSRFP